MTNLSLSQESFQLANTLQWRRGPDATTLSRVGEYHITHNLLSITGAFTTQPFIGDDVACVFNGQIYNSDRFGEYPSDGYCILDAYEECGLEFPNHLDGEFAICVLDLRREAIVLATDPFGTKPLHFAYESGKVGVATYESALEKLGFKNRSKVPANCMVIIDRKCDVVRIKRPLWNFRTDQYKMYCDHWIIAFENAIRKRTQSVREKIFIGLSSGYDSGAIACEMFKQRVPFKSYSFYNNENREVIDARRNYLAGVGTSEILSADSGVREDHLNQLSQIAEPGRYYIYSGSNQTVSDAPLLSDPAATGLAIICARATSDGCKIYLSGQGGDEIMSDYGYSGKAIYNHSNFGGHFPANLDEVFPWPSFYGSSQESYLMKEEYVAGAYSVETRYPFLDKFVVQEYLNLSHTMKNLFYKAPLRKYFKDNNFPVSWDSKHGFSP